MDKDEQIMATQIWATCASVLVVVLFIFIVGTLGHTFDYDTDVVITRMSSSTEAEENKNYFGYDAVNDKWETLTGKKENDHIVLQDKYGQDVTYSRFKNIYRVWTPGVYYK